MVDMKLLEEEFPAWVAEQDSDEMYKYVSNDECAFAQYLKHRGYSDFAVTPDFVQFNVKSKDRTDNVGRLSQHMREALIEHPHSFGSLAERLQPVYA